MLSNNIPAPFCSPLWPGAELPSCDTEKQRGITVAQGYVLKFIQILQCKEKMKSALKSAPKEKEGDLAAVHCYVSVTKRTRCFCMYFSRMLAHASYKTLHTVFWPQSLTSSRAQSLQLFFFFSGGHASLSQTGSCAIFRIII